MAGINLNPDPYLIIGQGTLFAVSYVIVRRWIMAPYSKLRDQRAKVTTEVTYDLQDIYAKIEERTKQMDETTGQTLNKIQAMRKTAQEKAVQDARVVIAKAQEVSHQKFQQNSEKIATSLASERHKLTELAQPLAELVFHKVTRHSS
ncbi:MAG: hypothetical protein OXC40_07040 [Proteobacteria bacterium]|nr:hypothetical protein [Pseudomonadota bacterium]